MFSTFTSENRKFFLRSTGSVYHFSWRATLLSSKRKEQCNFKKGLYKVYTVVIQQDTGHFPHLQTPSLSSKFPLNSRFCFLKLSHLLCPPIHTYLPLFPTWFPGLLLEVPESTMLALHPLSYPADIHTSSKLHAKPHPSAPRVRFLLLFASIISLPISCMYHTVFYYYYYFLPTC